MPQPFPNLKTPFQLLKLSIDLFHKYVLSSYHIPATSLSTGGYSSEGNKENLALLGYVDNLCARMLSHVQLFATLWTVDCQNTTPKLHKYSFLNFSYSVDPKTILMNFSYSMTLKSIDLYCTLSESFTQE